MVAGAGVGTPDIDVPVGTGQIDMPAVLAAARNAGTSLLLRRRRERDAAGEHPEEPGVAAGLHAIPPLAEALTMKNIVARRACWARPSRCCPRRRHRRQRFRLGTFERQGAPFVGVVLGDSRVIDLAAADAA